MGFLTGNALKLIAAASMFLDHLGLLFFPETALFRILGRLAFPIFAYMIAEGCKYTRSRRKYFLTVFLLALVCQVVYFLFDGSLYLSILVTFSLSILCIYALQEWKKARGSAVLSRGLLFAGALLGVWLVNQVFTVDYGFWGSMAPVFAALFQNTRWDRQGVHVAMLGLCLVILGLTMGGVQMFGLLALPLLLCYNGKRGKWKVKYFFYIFYPVHLALLQGLAMLLA